MKTLLTGLTTLVFLVALLGAALAQRPDPGPEEERMAQMMKMMEQMQGQMKEMHQQMGQMKHMQGQMSQMRQMHEQMVGMMRQHRVEMQKGCPGATVPDSKKGS